ncbi:MAG: 50S ribosomal protein L32 [Planctomycetaceae bacterium]
MAVPKRRHSPSRSRKRGAHHGIKAPKLQYCAQCQTAVPSHVVCPNCGHYHGRTLVEIED